MKYKLAEIQREMKWILELHPYITASTAAVILPIVMIVIVFIGTTMLTAPIAWMAGWR